MRKHLMVIVSILIVAFYAGCVSATPLDLSGFSADPGVSESGGVITFTPSFLAANYYYNDSFLVPATATILSFDYSLDQGPNSNDYLVFDLNYVETILTADTQTGNSSIDLSSFRGTQISLDWGLVWGGNDDTGTVGTISNIDLASGQGDGGNGGDGGGTGLVPESSSFILLVIGIAVSMCLRRIYLQA